MLRLEQPNVDAGGWRACRSCGRKLFGRSDVCRSRKCPEYSRVWAGDQRRKLFTNLAAFDAPVLLSAVTAPGADQLPWDEDCCAALGDHQHSGQLGCRVQQLAADEWNRSAPDRWRRLHRRAYQETVKQHGPRSALLLARVWEIQSRGVLHVHPVVACGTARQMAGARAYLERLAALGPQYGFGFVHHKQGMVKPQAAEGAAAYLSSYLVKGSGRKMAIWESVVSGAMPRSIVHISVDLTQQTHCTMRNLRLRRALFMVWKTTLPLNEVEAVARLLSTFSGNVEFVREYEPGRAPPVSAFYPKKEEACSVARRVRSTRAPWDACFCLCGAEQRGGAGARGKRFAPDALE
jgi:hypothetical protein